MDILILNIVIWIWKLTFQFWNLLFNFKKNLFDLEFDIWILNYYFGILNLYLNSKFKKLNLIMFMIMCVATLALGSQPRQGFAIVRAKREARECGRVWEWTLTLPNELLLLGIGVSVDY
jgi:hypothetical protein